MLTERELETLQRRARGESQMTVSRALGVSQAAISKFEANAHRKILEAEELLKIAKERNITTHEGPLGRRVIYKGGRR